MNETRLSAALLTCKIFLRYLDALLAPSEPSLPAPSEQNEDEDDDEPGVRIWARILELMERLVKSGAAAQDMVEAVPESIKNIVLVMASTGYIAAPGGQSTLQKRLWGVSEARLERFVPGLMAEVFPKEERQVVEETPEVVSKGVETGTEELNEKTAV